MKNNVSLKIVAKEKKPLTKNQQLFNRLTKKIEDLEAQIISENDKLIKLLELYANKIRPLLADNAQLKLKLAMTLSDTTKRVKFTKKQSDNIQDIILDLCNDSFSIVVPNAEQEAFYDQWSKLSYKEELEIQTKEDKEHIGNIINSTFGIDIDMDEFDDSPEGFAKLQEKLKAEYEKAQENESKTKRKKTKKQLQNEEKLETEESIKNKSVRSIYISLAKILHPDSEPDPQLKSEKEEIMKKVTLAYDQKDLSTLLKLEMEWVHKENAHLDKLAEDKLKIYISVLKERVSELTNEIYRLQMHPKFSEVAMFSRFPEKVAVKEILSEVKTQNKEKKQLTNSIEDLENSNDKKHINEFIKAYMENLHDDEMMDLLSSFFM